MMQRDKPAGSSIKKWIVRMVADGEYDCDHPDAYKPPTFEAGDPKLVDYFNDNGYVVVKGVANAEEVQHGISLFWDLLEAQPYNIKRDDPSTWNDAHWVADTQNGVMARCGVGQSAFLWHARTLPKVKQIFAQIWQTDDLLVSFDGCGVFRPPEYDEKWFTEGAWYHIDQYMPQKKGLHAIQGLVNFFPSGPTDGGFVCVPKSPKMMDAAVEADPKAFEMEEPHDYFQTPSNTKFWKAARDQITKRNDSNKYDLLPVKIVLDAGDMVLWDSRTIHCNHPATGLSDDPLAKTRLKRLAAYVCMTPAHLAKNLEQLIRKRVFAFQKGVTTTHWPHEFYPSWNFRENSGVGSKVVKLTPEQATLITGKQHPLDVYDEAIGNTEQAVFQTLGWL